MSFYKRAQKQTMPPLNLTQAKKKLMDFVAHRDHSEKELRKKLSLHCEAEVVEKTLIWAKKQNWLVAPEKLKIQFAEQLSRRGKGIRRINQQLEELGLDSIKSDKEVEFEKAKKLISGKWSAIDFKSLGFEKSQKLKAKIMRFLITRGYESEIVSLILKNEFKHSNISEDISYDEEF